MSSEPGPRHPFAVGLEQFHPRRSLLCRLSPNTGGMLWCDPVGRSSVGLTCTKLCRKGNIWGGAAMAGTFELSECAGSTILDHQTS